MLAAFVLATTAVETTAGASRAAAPGAPTTPSATPGNARATVRWTAPPGNGSAIVAYVITPYIGTTARPSLTFRSKATTEIVAGLKNGTAYTFRIAAKNAKGTGRRSAPTNPVRVGVPAAPAVRSAVAGNARATVSWAPPANNGSAIVAVRGHAVRRRGRTSADHLQLEQDHRDRHRARQRHDVHVLCRGEEREEARAAARPRHRR